MMRTFHMNLNLANHVIQDISFTWGMRGSELRESASAYGMDVEVPAVIELLDLVASGAVTAEQARDSLNGLATAINEKQDREYERLEQLVEEAAVSVTRSTPAPRRDSRWVYVVSTEDNPNVVKIGVAEDIDRRIRSLQTAAATRIVLRWSARGGLPLESYLHEQFQERRLSGEWFNFRSATDPAQAIAEAARVFLSDAARR